MSRADRTDALPRYCLETASIESVPYDAEAVTREVAAAGLPGEYAEKLVAAV